MGMNVTKMLSEHLTLSENTNIGYWNLVKETKNPNLLISSNNCYYQSASFQVLDVSKSNEKVFDFGEVQGGT